MGHVGQGGSSELRGQNPRVLSKMGESRLSLHVTRTCLPLTDDHGGGSRSPAAFGSLGIFLSVRVLCFALFLFPMRSSDAQGCDVAEMPFLWPCPHRTPLCAEGAGAGRPSACPAGQTPRAGSRALLTRVCSARRWRMCSPRLPPRGKSSDCSFYSHGRPVP